MKIYFDGTLIDPDYYTQLEVSKNVFTENDNFKLGSTICTSITLGVDRREISSIPSVVNVTIDDKSFGEFVVDKYEENDYFITFTLTDKMINFNFKYDASTLIDNSTHTETDGTKYVLLSELLQDMCTKANVTLATSTFIGSNKHISWYDNTITAREYIGFIAELNGGYAYVDNTNKLVLKQISNTVITTIDVDNVSNYKLGEYHKISRVAFDDGTGAFEPVGSEDNNTLYINTSNTFITEQTDIQNIYNVVKDIEFYSLEIEKYNIAPYNTAGNYINALDCIKFVNGDDEYLTFGQYTWNYNGGFTGGNKFIVNSEKQEETQYIDSVENKIKSIKTIVDRDNASIRFLATNTYTKEEIQEIASGNYENVEVSYVSTEQGKFSNEGLRIERLDTADNTKIISETSALFNEKGMTISKVDNGEISSESPILFSGYVETNTTDENLKRYKGQSVTASNNMIVNKYLVIGDKSRIENFVDENGVQKTGMFPL